MVQSDRAATQRWFAVVLLWAFMIASVVRAEDSMKICYNALYKNDVDKNVKIDAEEYVGVVHEMSNGFFNRNNPFADIPSSLKQNFQTLACLCQTAGNSDLPANVCCNPTNAHIQVSGTAPRARPTFEQQLYLENFCEDTYTAIALALIASSGPTVSPSALEITRFPTPSTAGPLEGCAKGVGAPFSGDNPNTKGTEAFGIIFHVRTRTSRPITVKSLRFLTSIQGERVKYKVYTRNGLDDAVIFGSAIQLVKDLSDWDEVADSNVTGRGLNLLTETNRFENPVYIYGNGQIQTFYLTLQTKDLRYLIGQSSPSVAIDQYLDVLTSGTGVKKYPGTSNLVDYSNDRSFIGQVVYTIPSLPCDSSAPTAAPSQADVTVPPSGIPETDSPVTKAPTLSPSISSIPSRAPNNFFNGPASVKFAFNISLNTTEGDTILPALSDLREAMTLLVEDLLTPARRNIRRLRGLLVSFSGTIIMNEAKIECPANALAAKVNCYSIDTTVPLLLSSEEDKDASVGAVKSFLDTQIVGGGLMTKVKDVNPTTNVFVIDPNGKARPTPSPQGGGSDSNIARTAGLAAGGVILLLGLVGGGYFLWQRRQQASVRDDSRQDLYGGKDNYNDSSYDVAEKPKKAGNTFDDRSRDDFDDDEYDSQSDYDSESTGSDYSR